VCVLVHGDFGIRDGEGGGEEDEDGGEVEFNVHGCGLLAWLTFGF